jgi:hypothetical protein
MLEANGEVLLTESGCAKYRITTYAAPSTKSAPPVDYWGRLISYQPKPISSEESQALNEENRGDR